MPKIGCILAIPPDAPKKLKAWRKRIEKLKAKMKKSGLTFCKPHPPRF